MAELINDLHRVNVNIVIAGIFGIIIYVVIMNLSFFKNNKRHGGFLTLSMAIGTIFLAIVLYIMKIRQG